MPNVYYAKRGLTPIAISIFLTSRVITASTSEIESRYFPRIILSSQISLRSFDWKGNGTLSLVAHVHYEQANLALVCQLEKLWLMSFLQVTCKSELIS